jgi:predicted NBD/HSP70 family sugar kinase
MTTDAAPSIADLPPAARALIRRIVRQGPLSRSQLARLMDLSPASLSRLTAPMITGGLLQETTGEQQSRTGRPSRPLDIVPGAYGFLGIKITGEEIYAVRTGLRAEIEERLVLPLPERHPEAVAEQLTGLIAGLPVRPAAVGIGLGGQVDHQRHVRFATFLGWEDVDLGGMLTAATGIDTVIDNDVVALARGLQWAWPTPSGDRLAVITIGIGVGYALIVHDEVLETPDTGIGLLGHFPLDPRGPRCSAGHRGCAAALLTTGAVSAMASVALQRSVSFEEAVELAASGHPGAGAIVADSAEALGRLIGAVANVTMTRRVVLTGEGLPLARTAGAAVDQGIAQARDPRATALDLEFVPHDFARWAQGAASSAIQHWLGSPGRRR